MSPHNPMIAELDATSSALADSLPGAINLLSAQRSGDVPAGRLDAYVALGWMRWAAGRLIVTPKGVTMRNAIVAREDSLLEGAEVDELRRQGAKAAARGDAAGCNPMLSRPNRPTATGEKAGTWAARSAAWQSGFEAQAPVRDSRSRSDVGTPADGPPDAAAPERGEPAPPPRESSRS